LSPTFVNLASAVDHLEFTNIDVAAQNVHQAESGAFTGEISTDMLTSIGVNTVILGHSERRAYHRSNALLSNKVDTALKHDMTYYFSVWRNKTDKKKQHFNVVNNQLRDGLFHIIKDSWNQYCFGIRTCLAIGTGETAS
jgi:triosephosphate isomerase